MEIKFQKINNGNLKRKQKEIYNYHKITSILADYGYASVRNPMDEKGADFFSIHSDGTLIKIQQKARFTISKKYLDKEIWIVFLQDDKKICLFPHDILVEFLKSNTKTNFNKPTGDWAEGRDYHIGKLTKILKNELKKYIL